MCRLSDAMAARGLSARRNCLHHGRLEGVLKCKALVHGVAFQTTGPRCKERVGDSVGMEDEVQARGLIKVILKDVVS